MNYLFVYTRLEKFDYRLIFSPDNQTLPQPIRGEFIDFAREVVDTDNFGPIAIPRFAIVKRGNLSLIGVGCRNTVLGTCPSTEETREIRGFFGVVTDSCSFEQINTLTNLEYYRYLFTKFIIPIWGISKREEDKINSIVQAITVPNTDLPFSQSLLDVNIDNNSCKVFPISTDAASLIKSCMSFNEVDAVVGLNSDKHILEAPLYIFHNVTICGVEEQSSLLLKKEPRVILDSPPLKSVPEEDRRIRRIIVKLAKYFSKYRISPIRFITLFTKKYNMKVVTSDVPKDELDKISKVHHSTVKPRTTTVDTTLEELEDFKNRKGSRKNSIADITSAFAGQDVADNESSSKFSNSDYISHNESSGELKCQKNESNHFNIEDLGL